MAFSVIVNTQVNSRRFGSFFQGAMKGCPTNIVFVGDFTPHVAGVRVRVIGVALVRCQLFGPTLDELRPMQGLRLAYIHFRSMSIGFLVEGVIKNGLEKE